MMYKQKNNHLLAETMSGSKFGTLKIEFDKSTGYSGGKLPLLQPIDITSSADLIRDARKVEHLLGDIAKSLVHKANKDLTSVHVENIRTSRFKQAPIKKIARIEEKAQKEYNNDYRSVRDVCRGGIYLDDNSKIAALSAVFDWAKEYEVELPHGAYIIVSDNRFKNPTGTGYSSHKINIAIPIPKETERYHVAELMLYHREFEEKIAADKHNSFGLNSHENYERARSLEAIAKSKVLTIDESKRLGKFIRVCKDIHNRARDEFHLDDIQTEMKKFISLRRNESWAAMDEYEKRNNAGQGHEPS